MHRATTATLVIKNRMMPVARLRIRTPVSEASKRQSTKRKSQIANEPQTKPRLHVKIRLATNKKLVKQVPALPKRAKTQRCATIPTTARQPRHARTVLAHQALRVKIIPGVTTLTPHF